MKRIIAWFACAMLLPVAVAAAPAVDWPLSDLVLKSADTRSQPYFIYVPSGQRFSGVSLRGIIVGDGHTNVLSVYLDGRLIKVLRPLDGDRLNAAMPDLAAGFHRIVLTGSPTVRAPEQQIGIQCPPLYNVPMSIEHLALRYTPQQIWPAELAQLPDGLYNRSYPASRPWLGSVVLDPANTVSATAILRLVGIFRANAGLRFVVGDDPQADFSIVLRKVDALGQKASIALQDPKAVRVQGQLVIQPRVPTLTLEYGDASALQNGINALLDGAYRRQLTESQAVVSSAVSQPRWGTLAAPDTLSALGLTDLTLVGNRRVNLSLAYPVYWQPTGPVKGHLLLKTQAGLPNDAHLNVWLDGTLAGSAPLDHLVGSETRRVVSVEGMQTPVSTMLGLQLDVVLDHRAFCQQPTPGKLWIDAQQSVLHLPHRDKMGIMQLLPALVARPLISTDGTGAALDVALAVALGEDSVTGGAPLPYLVHSGSLSLGNSENSISPTLSVAIDPHAVDVFAAAEAPHINAAYLQHAVWLHASHDGYLKIQATRAKSLRELAAVWPRVLERIPDGALDALVDADSGQVLVLRTLPSTAILPEGRLSDRQFEYGFVIVLVVAILFAAILFWLSRRRLRGAK